MGALWEGSLDGEAVVPVEALWTPSPPAGPLHPVPAQEHLSVSHINLTTLHGELSSLPSLRVSAAQDCREIKVGTQGKANPSVHPGVRGFVGRACSNDLS